MKPLAQTTIPGVRVLTEADRLRLKADAPLRAKKAQAPIGGLFDETATRQLDLVALCEAPATRTAEAK